MPKIRTISLGLSMLAAPALAQAPRPAVRLLPAKPMDPGPSVTARAADGFEPFPQLPRNDAARYRNLFESTRDDQPQNNGPSKIKKWMDERVKAVKTALSAPPEPQPEPRVGQPMRKLFESKPEQRPVGTNRVNTAEPAYRWYGWGTATPGANQYAPAGDYPNASAQWYSQTGATPGAFPVPTMNPYRPAPASEPPVYVPPIPNVAPPSTYMTVPPPGASPPPPRKTIAETPSIAPNVVPAMPNVIGPSNQVPIPPPEVRSQAIPKASEPAWKPVANSEKERPKHESHIKPAEAVIVPVIRGQEPAFDNSPLARKIHDACGGLATNVSIRETGPQQLLVSFQCTTKSLAEMTAKAVARIPELKPFTVEFAAKINQ